MAWRNSLDAVTHRVWPDVDAKALRRLTVSASNVHVIWRVSVIPSTNLAQSRRSGVSNVRCGRARLQ